MKKILSVVMAAAMLLTVFALCSSAKKAVTYPLSATAVSVAGDGDNDIYVVFSEPVQAPNGNTLSLVAYGWPATTGDPTTMRYGTRDTMVDVVAVSDTVWKFTKSGHKAWMISNDIAAEGHYGEAGAHPVDGNTGAYWSFMLFGTVKSVDGKKTLAVENDKPVLDNNFSGDPKYGYTLVRGQSANATEMTVGLNVPSVASVADLGFISVTAYDVTSDNNYLYLAFSEPVTLGADFRVAMYTRAYWGQGVNDYAWLYAEASDVLEQVDKNGCLYRVSNAYWKANGDPSLLFDPTSAGYFANMPTATDAKLVLQGTVTAKSGSNTIRFSNKDDAGDSYGGRFHGDLTGSNYTNGYDLTFHYEKVSGLKSVPFASANTADTTSVVAVLAVIALGGAALVSKKH